MYLARLTASKVWKFWRSTSCIAGVTEKLSTSGKSREQCKADVLILLRGWY